MIFVLVQIALVSALVLHTSLGLHLRAALPRLALEIYTFLCATQDLRHLASLGRRLPVAFGTPCRLEGKLLACREHAQGEEALEWLVLLLDQPKNLGTKNNSCGPLDTRFANRWPANTT